MSLTRILKKKDNWLESIETEVDSSAEVETPRRWQVLDWAIFRMRNGEIMSKWFENQEKRFWSRQDDDIQAKIRITSAFARKRMMVMMIYLEMMLFIFVSGAMPSNSVSSVAANRARRRSTLLCSLSISTSYWN